MFKIEQKQVVTLQTVLFSLCGIYSKNSTVRSEISVGLYSQSQILLGVVCSRKIGVFNSTVLHKSLTDSSLYMNNRIVILYQAAMMNQVGASHNTQTAS